MACPVKAGDGLHRRRPTVVTITEPQQPALFFTAFNELRQLQRFCDIQLCVRETTFLAHRIVLASGSPYLMELITQSTHGYVELFDSKLDVYSINVLIEFLYTSSICISDSTVLDLCYAAQVLKMGKVQKYCCKFLKRALSHSNVIPYLFFCTDNGYNTLGLKCSEFALGNMSKIMTQDSFLDLTSDDITKLIDLLNLCDTSMEMEIVFNWAHHNMPQRQNMLSRFLPIHPPVCHPPPPSCLTQVHTKMRVPGRVEINPEELTRRLLQIKQHDEVTCSAEGTSRSRNSEEREYNVLFAIGGTTDHSVTDTGEKFIIAKQRWCPISKMPQKKSHAPAVTCGSKIYSIGGFNGRKRLSSVNIYDTVFDNWIEGVPLQFPRSGCAAVTLNNELYVIGGYDGHSHLSSVEIFDFKMQKWRQGPPLTVERSHIQAVVVNGTIFVVGGANTEGRLRTAEKLSEHDTEWKATSLLNTCRSRPGVVVYHNSIYAIGGYDGDKHLSSVECYDVILDEWKNDSDMRTNRNSPGVAVLEDHIYAIGGHDGHYINKSVEIYNPRMNRWLDAVSMTTARCDFALVAGFCPQV